MFCRIKWYGELFIFNKLFAYKSGHCPFKSLWASDYTNRFVPTRAVANNQNQISKIKITFDVICLATTGILTLFLPWTFRRTWNWHNTCSIYNGESSRNDRRMDGQKIQICILHDSRLEKKKIWLKMTYTD